MKTKSHPALRYPLQVRWSEEDEAYLGSIPGLTGDCCHADTPEEVVSQLKVIAEDLVEYMTKKGKKLPAPPSIEDLSDPDPVAIRKAIGLSQTGFADFMGISHKTLHKWEQHTSKPSGAARTLLRVAAVDPWIIAQALIPGENKMQELESELSSLNEAIAKLRALGESVKKRDRF